MTSDSSSSSWPFQRARASSARASSLFKSLASQAEAARVQFRYSHPPPPNKNVEKVHVRETSSTIRVEQNQVGTLVFQPPNEQIPAGERVGPAAQPDRQRLHRVHPSQVTAVAQIVIMYNKETTATSCNFSLGHLSFEYLLVACAVAAAPGLKVLSSS
jgi:hypothetical protein